MILWGSWLSKTVQSIQQAVRLRRDKVVVVLEYKVLVFNFSDLSQLMEIDTISNPKVSTLNSHPSTLNPKPSTLHPPPSTLNPQSSTLNPTLNPQPSTLNPQPSTVTFKPQPPEPDP